MHFDNERAVIVWLLDLQLPMQSVLITTNVVGSNPTRGQVYLKQHYVIKFVSELQHFSVFFQAVNWNSYQHQTVFLYHSKIADLV
jgi:hypothetical protein